MATLPNTDKSRLNVHTNEYVVSPVINRPFNALFENDSLLIEKINNIESTQLGVLNNNIFTSQIALTGTIDATLSANVIGLEPISLAKLLLVDAATSQYLVNLRDVLKNPYMLSGYTLQYRNGYYNFVPINWLAGGDHDYEKAPSGYNPIVPKYAKHDNVVVNNLKNGESLLYDSPTSKWNNGSLGAVYPSNHVFVPIIKKDIFVDGFTTINIDDFVPYEGYSFITKRICGVYVEVSNNITSLFNVEVSYPYKNVSQTNQYAMKTLEFGVPSSNGETDLYKKLIFVPCNYDVFNKIIFDIKITGTIISIIGCLYEQLPHLSPKIDTIIINGNTNSANDGFIDSSNITESGKYIFDSRTPTSLKNAWINILPISCENDVDKIHIQQLNYASNMEYTKGNYVVDLVNGSFFGAANGYIDSSTIFNSCNGTNILSKNLLSLTNINNTAIVDSSKNTKVNFVNSAIYSLPDNNIGYLKSGGTKSNNVIYKIHKYKHFGPPTERVRIYEFYIRIELNLLAQHWACYITMVNNKFQTKNRDPANIPYPADVYRLDMDGNVIKHVNLPTPYSGFNEYDISLLDVNEYPNMNYSGNITESKVTVVQDVDFGWTEDLTIPSFTVGSGAGSHYRPHLILTYKWKVATVS